MRSRNVDLARGFPNLTKLFSSFRMVSYALCTRYRIEKSPAS